MSDVERLSGESQVRAASPRTAGDFESVLFPAGASGPSSDAPPFFVDLNLDQLIDRIVGDDKLGLRPVFHTPLRSAEELEFRHAVFRDLDTDDLRAVVDAFCEGMTTVRRYLVQVEKRRYALEQQRWFLDAALLYCKVIRAFNAGLAGTDPTSPTVQALIRHVQTYAASDEFTRLSTEADAALAGLSSVTYAIRIRGARVTVQRFENEANYTTQVEETFERFREAEAESHLVKIPDPGAMNHVEAQIIQRAHRLFPQDFAPLEEFCKRHVGFVDRQIDRFHLEVQFYLGYLDFCARLEGVPFCYPELTDTWDGTQVEAGVDLALAAVGNLEPGRPPVGNDLMLTGPERILVVTGPNTGGKTTFSRMVGQLHYLASLGVPVPARSARLVLTDHVFSLSGRRENVASLRSRLEEELFSLKEILDQATPRSLIVLNEVLASTTVDDAIDLGRSVLAQIRDLGCAAVLVTFVDELTQFGPETVSMVASVDERDPSVRTFRIVRAAADGRAYAWAIAQKYGLSGKQLHDRIGQ